MSRQGLLIGGLVTVLLAAVGLWWFTTFERVEQTIPLPPRGEARYNPFFALKETLKARGITVRSGAALLPERLRAGDVLLLGMDVRGLSPEKSQALLSFVEDGGHLLFVVPEDAERLGRLPDEFGLQIGAPHYACTGWAGDDALGISAGRWCSSHRFDLGRTPSDVALPSNPTKPTPAPATATALDAEAPESAPAHVVNRVKPRKGDADTAPTPSLTDAAAEGNDNRDADAEPETSDATTLRWYLPHDTDGALALSAFHGEGSYTALASTEPFTSSGLIYPGNSELVWQMLGPLIGADTTVELVYGSDIPPWYVLLFYQGWPVWLPLLVALLAGLWWRAQRFGPLLPALPPPRRALLDHVRASGEFQQTQGATQALLDGLRRRFRRSLERRDPALAALSPRELIPTLAARERVSEDNLRDALLPPISPPPRQMPRERLAALLTLLWRLASRR